MKELKELKVAIVHDWLVGGGAEMVVFELHKMFPDAPIYTSYCTDEWRHKLDNKVITGWLQLWPFSKLRKYLPVLRVWWFSRLKLADYDLIISSSGAEAKGIKVKKPTVHINYCHSPTHYYWTRYDDYMKRPGFGFFNPVARLGLRLLVGPLRRWDYKAAQRPDVMIANSSYTQANIKTYYGRDASVVHPPVDIARFKPLTNTSRRGFIVTGRQTPYKRIDLAVLACSKLNLPLEVVGKGPEHARLLSIAGPSVNFVTNASDEKVAECLASAQAFIFPNADDFGIAAVEAMAAGTPIIAYKAGGALDYVKPGVTGEFFEKQTVESLTETLKSFDSSKFDQSTLTKSAGQFSQTNFRDKLNKAVLDLVTDRQNTT